jgi:hypothetical protein
MAAVYVKLYHQRYKYITLFTVLLKKRGKKITLGGKLELKCGDVL